MLKLKFNLRHQDIQLVNKGAVVATDSKDYLVAKFNTISDDWETPLTAIFTDDKHKQPYAVIVGADARLAEDECFVPWEVLTDAANVYVSIYCGNLHTTVTAAFKVRKSGYIDGETPPPPSPTVYDIIMQAITDLQVGKQDKLTAGENITIDENGRISASGGVTSYTELSDKPSINSVILSGNKTADDLGLQNKLIANEDIVISQDDNISIKEHSINFKQLTEGMSENLLYSINLMAGSTGSGTNLLAYLKPNTIVHVDFNNAARDAGHLPDPSFNGYFITLLGSSSESVYIQIAISFGFSPKFYIRCGSQRSSAHRYYSSWKRLNIELSSAAVNQNGTITFTMSDGTTVTTTGESVIGPQGPAGADGNDYVLTNQDKSDIANLVLAQLPTTQGVLYGNANN